MSNEQHSRIAALALLCGCYATTDLPSPACNPSMLQCSPADYPPLTAQLPPWPFPRLVVEPPSELGK